MRKLALAVTFAALLPLTAFAGSKANTWGGQGGTANATKKVTKKAVKKAPKAHK